MENYYELILKSKEQLKINIKKKIIFSAPIISREGIGIFYPNTINVIQGKSGVHKSRLVENIASGLLSSFSFLGFEARANDSIVLYVDTERNIKDQFPFALQKIIEKAGGSVEEDLSNFDYLSLIEVPRPDRFRGLKEYLIKFREKSDKHLIIILDVITDCIANFNDVNESLKLIDLLNLMINNFNATFICLIHENPTNSDKARGHLGTEILNKASTVIQIGFEKDKSQKDTDLIKVNYLKCRNSRKPDAFYLQYSEETKGLVLADTETINMHKENRKLKVNSTILKEILTKELTHIMEKAELMKILIKYCFCSDRTLDGLLKPIMDNKEVVLNSLGEECFLIKETIKRKAFYNLVSKGSFQVEASFES